MSGTVGSKTQFFEYIIDIPIGQTTVEYQDQNGVNRYLFYNQKAPTQLFIDCATYGTIYLNGGLSFAINESCPGNTICNQSPTITNNGNC